MKKLIIALAILSSSIAQAASWTSRPNWVTEFLAHGGDIKDVTGAKQTEGWQFRASWSDMSDVLSDSVLPSHFDWGDYYQLQPIDNQGNCGSCWNSATTAAFESAVRIAHPPSLLYDLSKQEGLSCSGGGSCGGGYFDALDYMVSHGTGKASDFPYVARDVKCKEIKTIAKLKEWHYIGTNGNNPTTAQLKAAIFKYGPIVVDVNATAAFSSYGSGVFTSCASANSTNHMVVINSWTDDPTYAAYGGGYFKVRNSWSQNFGESGYIRMVYKSKSGSNCSGLGNVAAYVIVDGLPRNQ